jgi:hypothetical protein
MAGYAGNDVPASLAMLNSPRKVVAAPNGNLYFTDFGNNLVRVIVLGDVPAAMAPPPLPPAPSPPRPPSTGLAPAAADPDATGSMRALPAEQRK